MLTVYTSTYRYNGPDRLDITVKGQDKFGKLFAPTWAIVKGYKSGAITEEEYTRQYLAILLQNTETIIELLKRDRVVLVCFCMPGAFCHRYILAELLQQLGAEYKGEIK